VRHRSTLLIALVTGVALMTSGLAATHDPDGDRVVGPMRLPTCQASLPVDVVEPITYGTMADNADRLESVTGRDVTYSYVLVTVCGETMAVDPFRFNR
jgi:hypothetical protein